MIVKYNALDRFEKPKLTLCNPGAKYENGYLTKVLGTLSDYDSEEIIFNFNSTSDLNFRIYKADHDDPERNAHAAFLYNAVRNKRLIFVDNIGFFVISETNTGYEGLTDFIDVTAHSAETEIEQKKVPYIENGTYPLLTQTVEGEEKEGLLNILVDTLPNWSIGTVAQSVANSWRTFEDISLDTNILSLMLQNMQDAYECIFVFDIIEREINVYAQNDYVHETGIHLTKDDLINTLHIDENAADVYTAISVVGNDNITINAINPLGTNTIYDFTYYLDWMSDGLAAKVRAWQTLVISQEEPYYNLSQQYYTKLGECSTASQAIQQLQTQVTILKRLRENLVAGSSEYVWAEYAKVIMEAGGASLDLSQSISAIIAEVNERIRTAEAQIQTLNEELDGSNDDLNELEQAIEAIVDSVAITSYFTEEEYNELYYYIFEGSYTDDYVIITDIMTPVEQFNQMKTMYDRAQSQLKRVSKPTQQFTLDVENFIFAKEFLPWSEQLETGCLINVEVAADDVAPLFLTNITINYDDHALSMTFGNRFNRYDPKSLFENVLGGINKSANSINFLKEAVYPITNNFNAMREQIQAARDITMDAALASENQEVVIDGSGYTGREVINDTGEYDPHQIKITGRNIVFTDDAWESAKTAIGEIYWNGSTTYGINAETIVGDLIVGNQLVIKDNNGNDMFTVIDGRISSAVSSIDTRLSQTIIDTTYSYCVRPIGTSPSANDSDWSATFPASHTKDERVWKKTIVVFESGLQAVRGIEDITGAQGEDGENGSDGISVVSIEFEYCLSGSREQITPIVTPGDETITGEEYPSVSEWVPDWSPTPPAHIEGYYYWRRSITTYSDGTEVVSEPYLDEYLNEIWSVTDAHSTTLVQTDEKIETTASRVTTNEGNILALQENYSDIKQTADEVSIAVRDMSKEYVSKDELGYDSDTHTIASGSILDITSQAITTRVWETENGQYVYNTVSSLSELGLSVQTSNSDTRSTINGDGLIITKEVAKEETVDGQTQQIVQNMVVAKFTRDIAYTNNLQIATFATIGAHRFEAIEGTEWDGVQSMGTGLAWIGKQEELVETFGGDS